MESESLIAHARSLHALIGIDGRDSLSQIMRDYKRITAKIAGIRWQRNFFDHRLRHDESLAEKFAYICQNPIRAGLISGEQNWPYVLIPDKSKCLVWVERLTLITGSGD